MPVIRNRAGEGVWYPESTFGGDDAASMQEQREDDALWGSGAARDRLARQELKNRADIEQARGQASRDVAGTQAAAQQNVAEIQAAATIAAARARRGYAQGGPVYKYKTDHPFNKSFDSKLLKKSRG
jgi:hypothetical protein